MSDKLERTINVDDDKEKTIRADQWHEMTVSELQDQLDILRARMNTASTMANVPLMQQLQTGISQLESMIKSKSANNPMII